MSRWQADLPLTTPTLMALAYVVLFRIYFVAMLRSLTWRADDGALKWPGSSSRCAALAWVNWAWITLLLIDGFAVFSSHSRCKKTQLAGITLALACVLGLVRVVSLIRDNAG